ncbi:MAG: hypothetical protein M3014_13525 [Chloroflexota bacterium]|nr:hypothetical protein [Chloroflexota bacterium]
MSESQPIRPEGNLEHSPVVTSNSAGGDVGFPLGTGRKRLSATEAKRLRVNLLRVAGLAACLALLMETVLVLGGQAVASLASLLDHGLWPYMVCMAVGIGQAIAGGWPPRAGGFAVIATPAAFLLAKIIQKGMETLLQSSGAANAGPLLTGDLLLEAGLRALEYAVLAAALAWLVHQAWAGALAHLGLGLAVGVVFGLLIELFLKPASLLGWIVAELIFPAGCALVVFASETLKQLLPEEMV